MNKLKNSFRSLMILGSALAIIACSGASAEKNGRAAADHPPEQAPGKAAITGVKFGKYGCTASKYTNGSVEYQQRGFITLDASGNYIYQGFEKPSKGTYTVDAKGNLHFKGGYLDKGEATKIDRPDKYFLVFPTIPDNRWTIGWVE